MPNLVPGVRWEPVDVGDRAARVKGRALLGHVAVSGSTNLRPGPLATRPSDWHFYLPKVGVPIQQIDLDVQCWASAQGNRDCVAFESEGGLGDSAAVNAEPWTEDQLNGAAMILAHLNRTEGTPLRVMASSLPTERGFGVHRFGIDPWRVPGGQSWSSSRGKLCPGDAKVAQAGEVVRRAALLLGTPATVPVKTPAPAGVRVPMPAWPLPAGHYIGLITGPSVCHGGDPRYDSAAVRAAIRAVQQVLIASGCVPGLPASAWRVSGWADGRFEAASVAALRTWFARYRGSQPRHDQVWADDYRVMASRSW